MKFTERILQQWRFAKARPYIPCAARVLDIGSRDGTLFQRFDGLIRGGMGIDPVLKHNTHIDDVLLIAGCFPKHMPDVEPFDAITMLAVLEHIPPSEYAHLSHACARFLKPGGVLIITVPSSKVDLILRVLKFFRLIDGMSLEQHFGYDVAQTTVIFSADCFDLKRHTRFQLGLNHVFVFKRRTAG